MKQGKRVYSVAVGLTLALFMVWKPSHVTDASHNSPIRNMEAQWISSLSPALTLTVSLALFFRLPGLCQWIFSQLHGVFSWLSKLGQLSHLACHRISSWRTSLVCSGLSSWQTLLTLLPLLLSHPPLYFHWCVTASLYVNISLVQFSEDKWELGSLAVDQEERVWAALYWRLAAFTNNFKHLFLLTAVFKMHW